MTDTERPRQAYRPDARRAYERARLIQQILAERGIVVERAQPRFGHQPASQPASRSTNVDS